MALGRWMRGFLKQAICIDGKAKWVQAGIVDSDLIPESFYHLVKWDQEDTKSQPTPIQGTDSITQIPQEDLIDELD